MELQEIKKKKVSFSQYSMWMKCPYSWKLNYLEGKRIYDADPSLLIRMMNIPSSYLMVKIS